MGKAGFAVTRIRGSHHFWGTRTSSGRKPTPVDFTFCCIVVDLSNRTPEKTAACLIEYQARREKGEDYALGRDERHRQSGANGAAAAPKVGQPRPR